MSKSIFLIAVSVISTSHVRAHAAYINVYIYERSLLFDICGVLKWGTESLIQRKQRRVTVWKITFRSSSLGTFHICKPIIIKSTQFPSRTGQKPRN